MSDEAGGEAAAAGASREATLVVVDPDPAERDRVEEWEAELGATVVCFAPDEFGPHMLDEVEDASAFVIAWDLGVRCGLHLVEALRDDERLQRVPIVLASASPTRSMVVAALRSGATSFALKPYDADELRRRLAPPEGAAGEGDAAG